MLNQGSLHRDEEGESGKNAAVADQQLIRMIARGDHNAFTELYNDYSVSIYNYLLRLIHIQNVAEDLLQETFVAVWKGAGRFHGRSTVKTWLFRIGHNQAVSWLRKEAGNELVDEEHLPPVEPQIEERLMLEWRTDQLLDALEELSANHRAVIELVFVHEMSYAEVAQVMNCPEGTVKSRMSYALKRLNKLIGNQF
jgi:RNA polymerase sigma-70 factor (ECF subfamily)